MTVMSKVKMRVIAACVCAAAAVGVGCCAGCLSASPDRTAAKAELASVMRLAYEVGAKDAVANRIDKLVEDGKITEDQAALLRAAAQAAYEHTLSRLEGGTNAVHAAVDCAGGACSPTLNCGDGGGAPATNCVEGVCADDVPEP